MPTISPYPAQIATETNLRDMVQYVDAINAEDYNLMRAYIRDMTATLGINPHGDAADLTTRLNVALKADGTPKSPLKLVRVAKSLGDFTSIQSAIDSITDSDYGNPYLVHVYPGLYEESIYLKSGVHVVALDKIKTMIKGKVTYESSDEGWLHFGVPVENLNSDGISIDAPDGSIYLTAPAHSETGKALIAAGGNIYCSANLRSSGASAIHCTGASLFLNRISAVTNCNSANAHAIALLSGNLTAAFCSFQCLHADALTVYAISAKNVKIYGSWANRNLDSDVTNLIANGLTVDSNIEAMF